MNLHGQAALVTGGASGLGAATARLLAARGAKVALLDRNGSAAQALAAELSAPFGGDGAGRCIGITCDVTDEASVQQAIAAAAAAHGTARILMNVAGIGDGQRIIRRDGSAAPLAEFRRVVEVNLVGTYNVARLAVAGMARLGPLADLDAADAGGLSSGERGVVVCTASVAAFDGQIGQEAYSASKGGVVAMTLPMARDLAQYGIRVCTIAPGLFDTPLLESMPERVRGALAGSIPFPKRLGRPAEFAQLALAIVENPSLNGEVIRLDGALRMTPR